MRREGVVKIGVPFIVVLALVGTFVLAQLVTLLPIRRAVRYRPGNALRDA